jgi:hypothetical protein
VFPPFLPKDNYSPWWSSNLNALRKQVKALKRRVKRCKNQILKEIYTARLKAIKNLYKSELLKTKQESCRNVCVESSNITPWEMYKACKTGFTRQLVPSSLTLQDGSTTTSVKETANAVLHNFFRTTLLTVTTENKETRERK